MPWLASWQTERGACAMPPFAYMPPAIEPGPTEFGNGRLEQLLREWMNDSPAALRDQIAVAVDTFTGTAAQKDDQTLVIARLA